MRNVLLGGGLAYAVQTGNYHHIPVVFFVPSVYAGYQSFSNRDAVAGWIREKSRR
jgi:hypothetical protein